VPLLPLLPLESPVLESVVLLELDLERLLKSFRKEGAIIYPNARRYNQVAIGPELNIGNGNGNGNVRLKAKQSESMKVLESQACGVIDVYSWSC
jgi:hypothetical protein